jgi:hypothetical protein
MKTSWLAIALVFVSVAAASAAVQVGDKFDYVRQTAYSQGNGGEFQFTVTPTSGSSYSLTTFCAQVGEYIATPMYVVQIMDNQNSGGQHLSDFGEWLFWAYATPDEGTNIVKIKDGGGNWVAPNLNRSLTGGVIQWAIWNDMQMTPSFALDGGANTGPQHNWLAALHEQYNTDSASGGAWANARQLNGSDPVAIAWMSPTRGGTATAQDQLVLIPCGLSSTVPEPASITIWALMGGLGTAYVVRKRRNRA